MKIFCLSILLCTVLGGKPIFGDLLGLGDKLNELAQKITPKSEDVPPVTPKTEAPAAESATPKPERQSIKSGSIKDRQRLISDLFESYDKKNYPDTDLKFGISLIHVDLDEDASTMKADIWLRMVWKDSRLSWKKEEYNDVGVLRLPSDEVWKPDMALYNNAEHYPYNMDCWDSNVLAYPNGEVLWVPPCQVTAFCNHTLDTDPYGPQTCTLKFGSWTFDANTIPIKSYNNATEADVSDQWDISDWEITGNHAEVVHRYYSCCEEPYATAEYNITVQRKPSPHNSKKCSKN